MSWHDPISLWLNRSIPRIWYRCDLVSSIWAWFFSPLSLIFCSASIARRRYYRHRSLQLAVPLIVVGNISVGGAGKTPMVIFLAQHLRQLGLTPGIISRGYGVKFHRPRIVDAQDTECFGDEAVLLAKRTRCPVVVGSNRGAVATLLLNRFACNIILSDDGLQHYALARDLELIVIDGDRVHGNGYCLPSGPLRERPSRLRQADFILDLGKKIQVEHWLFELVPTGFVNLKTGQSVAINYFSGQRVHALAGIANTQRFFILLQSLGMMLSSTRTYPDHYRYHTKDLQQTEPLPVVMTEKDAVKCQSIASSHCWYLVINVKVEQGFLTQLNSCVLALTQREDKWTKDC